MEKGLRKFDDFKKYKSLIEKLMDSRVLNIKYSKSHNKFFLREMCDQYFSFELDEEECVQLSSLFGDLAKKISEYEDSPPKEHHEAILQEELEDEQKRLQREESDNRAKSTLTVTDYLMITVTGENNFILYSYLSSFSKRADGYIEASFVYGGDDELCSDVGETYRDITGETIAHDECGVPRKRIKILLKKIKLVDNKLLFKEQDMKIKEEDIAG